MTPTTTPEQQMAYIDAVQDKSALEHVTQIDWLPECFRLLTQRYLLIAKQKVIKCQNPN